MDKFEVRMPRILLEDDEPFNLIALKGIIKMLLKDTSGIV